MKVVLSDKNSKTVISYFVNYSIEKKIVKLLRNILIRTNMIIYPSQ